jgi:hypothetical protein
LENNPALTDYVKILSPSHGAQPESNSANPTLSAESLPSNTDNASSSHLNTTDSSDTSVFYLNYQFLSVGNLQILLSGDIDYLELQGCFLIPRREILDDFIDHYFLHVHPLLPLFNEADFWKMYCHRGSGDSTGSKISLLVFQAVMFASCNVSIVETLGERVVTSSCLRLWIVHIYRNHQGAWLSGYSPSESQLLQKGQGIYSAQLLKLTEY